VVGFRIVTGTRILYISGSVGLGHARRDLAIARELRRLDPGVGIVWLAGEPARQVIAEAGETLLPESAAYGDETAVAEDATEGFSLNLLGRFALGAQGAFKRTVATFEKVSAKYTYDLLIGDETYEIDAALDKRPELKEAPFVMIYDFVGMDAMSRNPLERLVAYRVNWVWGGGLPRQAAQEDLTLLIGNQRTSPIGLLVSSCPTGASTRAATTTSSDTLFPSIRPTTRTRRRCAQPSATTMSAPSSSARWAERP
jgi:hypothetical protein